MHYILWVQYTLHDTAPARRSFFFLFKEKFVPLHFSTLRHRATPLRIYKCEADLTLYPVKVYRDCITMAKC